MYTLSGGGHKFFVLPDAWGDPLAFTDNGTATAIAMNLTMGTLVNANMAFSWAWHKKKE